MEHMLIVAPPALKTPAELARFKVEPQGPLWSADRQALFVPLLKLAPCVIREVVNGGTLFSRLNGVHLLHVCDQKARYHHSRFSYVWGDLQVFETGSPTITGAIFLRGAVALPDLTIVGRYVKEMPKPS